MGELIETAVAGIKSQSRIRSEDVLGLRRQVYGDHTIDRQEADALIALNSACPDQCPEWHDFLVEAITDYIVHQEKPAGYIVAGNAEWLIAAVSRDGKVTTLTELELLVRVLETAKYSTEELVSFALEQVKYAVTEGNGPLARGGELVPGVIGEPEVDLLRRILYAFGGDGNVGVTRAEAEILFAINDAIADADNHPSWNELFVKAIANFVMCASGYEAPTRDEALRRESFFGRSDADIGGFFARMVSGGAGGILAAYRRSGDVDADWEARNRRVEASARLAERIDHVEARWLAERIGRDGRLHENEHALISFIKQTSPAIHPDLKALLDRVA